MAMLRYIDDLCVPVYATLIYRARSERDMFFLRDLSALRARLPNFHFVPVLSQAPRMLQAGKADCGTKSSK